ncbi:hypothetical protein TURU_142312 [Turdus rufiventris]|nr:hypothetical protein TURU_142312 [Turdus rufiventris]
MLGQWRRFHLSPCSGQGQHHSTLSPRHVQDRLLIILITQNEIAVEILIVKSNLILIANCSDSVQVVYLASGLLKVYNMILIEKLTKYGLDEETLRGTVNWLKTQTVVASGIKSSWSTVAGSVSQRSTPSHTIFIEVLDDGAECNLSWFVDVLIQGGVDDQRL